MNSNKNNNTESSTVAKKPKSAAVKTSAYAKKQLVKTSRVTASVLQELYRDHRNIEKTLSAFEDQLQVYKDQGQTDLQIMHDVISYMIQAPDIYHHPFEEKMFAMLVAKDKSLQAEVNSTVSDHHSIKLLGESVLHCLENEMAEPGMLKDKYIVNCCDKYIVALRTHMYREEQQLFRKVTKLLTVADWDALTASMQENPEDPLFADKPETAFENLSHYFLEQVETIVEKYAEQQYLPVNQYRENMTVLFSGVNEIKGAISKNSRRAIDDTVGSYRQLLTTRPRRLAPWFTTPLGCVVQNFNYYASTVKEVAEILNQTYDTLSDNGLVKPKSTERV